LDKNRNKVFQNGWFKGQKKRKSFFKKQMWRFAVVTIVPLKVEVTPPSSFHRMRATAQLESTSKIQYVM
jgi:hypothetical protein